MMHSLIFQGKSTNMFENEQLPSFSSEAPGAGKNHHQNLSQCIPTDFSFSVQPDMDNASPQLANPTDGQFVLPDHPSSHEAQVSSQSHAITAPEIAPYSFPTSDALQQSNFDARYKAAETFKYLNNNNNNSLAANCSISEPCMTSQTSLSSLLSYSSHNSTSVSSPMPLSSQTLPSYSCTSGQTILANGTLSSNSAQFHNHQPSNLASATNMTQTSMQLVHTSQAYQCNQVPNVVASQISLLNSSFAASTLLQHSSSRQTNAQQTQLSTICTEALASTRVTAQAQEPLVNHVPASSRPPSVIRFKSNRSEYL